MNSRQLRLLRLAGITVALFLLVSALPVSAAWPPMGWVYQLQNYDLQALADAAPDVAVIDYSSTGGESGEWTPAQIQSLKDAGITVLCYLSIGEAETYRYYWQNDWTPGNPAWLGPVNPDWAGNYKVRYWMQGWRDILFGIANGDSESYLDRICDQGFDGIYLDIVDAYYYWSDENPENPNAAHDMVQLVHDLAEYARTTRGMGAEFKVIPQNGEWLRYDAPSEDVDLYYATVDGIGVEDVFYYGDSDENNSYNPRTESVEIIDQMIERGKVVLSVEYLTQMSLIEDYYVIALEHGWTPVACHRDLDRLDYYPSLLDAPESGADVAKPQSIEISAWPNPFNREIRIAFSLPHASDVELRLVNVLGHQVVTEGHPSLTAGRHELHLNADGLSSGTYYIQLRVGNEINRARITLLK